MYKKGYIVLRYIIIRAIENQEKRKILRVIRTILVLALSTYN